jgi:hypothetical protein
MSDNRRTNEEWLTGILEGLAPVGSENLEPLQQMREMQAAYRVLLQHESERLKKVYGDAHPLVLQMQNRLGRNLTLVETLEVEDQVRRIQVKETGEKESLVHGRVTDESSRGLVGFTVTLTDEEGKDLGIAGAGVDSTGYFSVVVPEEQADQLSSEKKAVYLAIKNRKGEICERRPVSQSVGPGARVAETIALSRTQRAGKTAETGKSARPSPTGKATKRRK